MYYVLLFIGLCTTFKYIIIETIQKFANSTYWSSDRPPRRAPFVWDSALTFILSNTNLYTKIFDLSQNE